MTFFAVNIQTIPKQLSGQILLADPSLRNEIFHKTVILLADHSAEEGAFGLILNRPTGQTVGELLTGGLFTNLADIAVHNGGPVGTDQLTFGAFWVRNDKLGFAMRISAEEAEAYSNQPNTLVRAFAGYSGWGKNQLEDELKEEAWTVVSPTQSILSNPHDITLWKQTMSDISPYHRILAGAPDEILAN